MTALKGCPFCLIAAGKDPAVREVWRNEYCVAFFPIDPASPGHTLVIPKEHIPNIWGVDSATGEQISKAVLLMSHALKNSLSPEGLNIVQSNGVEATQTVPHLHVHLVPRWADDDMPQIWPDRSHVTDSELEQILKKVKTACLN